MTSVRFGVFLAFSAQSQDFPIGLQHDLDLKFTNLFDLEDIDLCRCNLAVMYIPIAPTYPQTGMFLSLVYIYIYLDLRPRHWTLTPEPFPLRVLILREPSVVGSCRGEKEECVVTLYNL